MNKFLALMLALVMAFGLVACSNQGGQPSNPGNPDNPPAENSTPAEGNQPSGGNKIDINVIAAAYGQNAKQWWAGPPWSGPQYLFSPLSRSGAVPAL